MNKINNSTKNAKRSIRKADPRDPFWTVSERQRLEAFERAKSVHKRLVTFHLKCLEVGDPEMLTVVRSLLTSSDDVINRDIHKLMELGRARGVICGIECTVDCSYVPETVQGRALVIGYLRGMISGVEEYMSLHEVTGVDLMHDREKRGKST